MVPGFFAPQEVEKFINEKQVSLIHIWLHKSKENISIQMKFVFTFLYIALSPDHCFVLLFNVNEHFLDRSLVLSAKLEVF